MHTTAMMVPKTQDLMQLVTISQDVMARQAESNMTLAETPYTLSARPTLAARPANNMIFKQGSVEPLTIERHRQ